ncbi:hypothetical protein ACLOJK_013703 [Asimina triloba]
MAQNPLVVPAFLYVSPNALYAAFEVECASWRRCCSSWAAGDEQWRLMTVGTAAALVGYVTVCDRACDEVGWVGADGAGGGWLDLVGPDLAWPKTTIVMLLSDGFGMDFWLSEFGRDGGTVMVANLGADGCCLVCRCRCCDLAVEHGVEVSLLAGWKGQRSSDLRRMSCSLRRRLSASRSRCRWVGRRRCLSSLVSLGKMMTEHHAGAPCSGKAP